MIDSLRMALRWLSVPWREASLVIAIIAAAAAPAFLAAAADVWGEAAGDELTGRLLEGQLPLDHGLVITADAVFDPEPAERLDRLVVDRLGRVDGLAPPVRSLYTFQAPITLGPDSASGGVPVRVLARPGAVEALDVVDRLPGDAAGVWVSTWFAEFRSVGLGDEVLFTSPADPEDPQADAPGTGRQGTLPVVGIYESLWAPEGARLDDYWRAAPPSLIPQYLAPFNAPTFALFVTDEATLLESGLGGAMQWDAPLPTAPDTLDELAAVVAGYRSFEGDLVRAEPLAEAFRNAAGGGASVPQVVSQLPDTLAEATSALDALRQPFASARAAGIVLGVAVMAAAGVFVVHKWRIEFRLMTGEGERWVRLATRTALQLVVPTALGAAGGAWLAVAVGVWLGPARTWHFASVDVTVVAVVAAAGLAATALVTGFLGQSTLDEGELSRRRYGVALVTVAVAVAVGLWVLAGRTPARGAAAVDLAAVVLPLVALGAAVGVVSLALQWVAGRFRLGGGKLPVVVLLAWRRVMSDEVGSRLLTGVLATGFGLVVFSVVLVGTLDRTVEVKLAAEVGAETRIDVIQRPGADVALPAGSAIVSTERTQLIPGDGGLFIVAVDPETVAEAVTWPEEYGAELSEVVELITQPVEGEIPVVAIEGQGVPASGGFGISQAFPYTVVGTVEGLPLASDTVPTVLLSGPLLDDFALGRQSGSAAAGSPVRPPTDRFRHFLVSQSSPAELQPFLEGAGLRTRETVTRDQLAGSTDVLGPTFAFSYLRLLGFVAAAGGLGAVLLYLSARREAEALGAVLTNRMGLSWRRSRLVVMVEIVVLTVVAALTASALVPALVDRLVVRFDPAPRLPPTLDPVVSPVSLVAAALGLFVVLGLVVWVFEMGLSRRDVAKVLRGLE